MTNTDRRYGVSDALAWKAPVRAATTGNIALSGEQTIDGLACVEGDRVLVWQQTAGRENGIYVVSTGNWRRAADADGMRDLATGTMLVVTGGSSYQWAIFQLMTTGDIAIDDTALTFQTLSVQVAGSFRATSVTSLPISVGAKTFAIEANRAFTAGDYVIAKSDANANNFMVGQVTSYGGTTLVVDVEAIGGSGTHAGWSIAISGSPGATGATGPAVSGIGDVPGLAAALDAKLDDSQTGAVGLNVLTATTQAAGRAAINAADSNDPKLLHRQVARLFNRTCPMGPSYHPAFVMGDGSVTVTGQNVDSLAQGANVQINLLPQVVVLPEGLLGTPIDVIVGHNRLYILTDQGDVCAAGYNAEGQLGDNSTTTRTVAVLLNASDIGPRSAGGASRAITKIETTDTQAYSTSAASQSAFFVCADRSLWATGYHGGSSGALAGGTVGTSALKPTRCLKTANSTAQATAQGTNSASSITPSVTSKTFTVAAGKSWVAGDPIYIYSHASAAVWMFGSVISYSGTTLVVNVTAIGTATASSDWIISELVNDAANVYASGGVEPSVGYITTSGKVRFAGRLYHGIHGLCSTGPGSGTAVANFPAFRLPKTTSDDASSQLPDSYVCTKIAMGSSQVSAIGSAVLLCTDKNAYAAGYASHGANGDGTVAHAPNYKKVGSGTVMAATISGHVDDVWHVGLDNPAYIAQLDTNQCVGWGYGTPFVIPGQSAAIISTPVTLAAPFDGTKRIRKISATGHFSTSERVTVAALTTDNLVYSWGKYAFQGGLTPAATSTPTKVSDPYKGAVTISDIKVGGYATVIGLHVLYDNGEVWSLNNNTYTNGELGIGNTNGPYMPVRMRF
jgi:alpha-tubulin suppressor-like RCC1 family protein